MEHSTSDHRILQRNNSFATRANYFGGKYSREEERRSGQRGRSRRHCHFSFHRCVSLLSGGRRNKMASVRNVLFIGFFCGYVKSIDAFAAAPKSTSRATFSTSLQNNRNSPGFVGFSGDGNPIRSYDSQGSSQSMGDPFSPQMSARGRTAGPPPRGMWQEPSANMYGQVYGRQSNLSPYSRQSVNDMDPRAINIERDRYSQRPHPSTMMPPNRRGQTSPWQGMDGRIQGGSRHTYDNYGSSQTFIETDGRPLDVEMEIWDGPNNSPTRVKMYSEDGRQRPMNILTDNMNGRGGTVSVRNTGSMEFPINAGVSSMNRGGYGGPEMMMGAPNMMMQPNFSSPNGFVAPSTSRGETVQGGALKTFSLNSSVNAVQVTITSDGLPVNAKVELWGTSTHVKQLAEVYNDNGQTRPFAAIIDVPGGENTIAVRNTGPMEYPIKVVVEPVGMGRNNLGGNGNPMMGGGDIWDGPPPFPGGGMMDDPMMMMDGPPMLPPPW